MSTQCGRHLIIDGIFDPSMKRVLADRTAIAQYLEDVTDITNMTLVFPPIAMSFPFSGETNRLIDRLTLEGKCNESLVLEEFKKHIHERNTVGGGVSAIAVWVESHCSVHSWTEQDYVSIDLFSCSSYDFVPVILQTVKQLGLIKASFVVVDRHMDGSLPEIEKFSLEEFNKKYCAVL